MKFIFFSDGNEEKKNNTGLAFGLLVVFGLILLVLILPNVYGLYMPQSHEELMDYKRVYVVVTGTIIDTQIKNETNFYTMGNETHTNVKIYYDMERVYHTVLVDEYLKNTLNKTDTVLEAKEPTISLPGASSTMGKFFKDKDYVMLYFYLDTIEYLPESHIIEPEPPTISDEQEQMIREYCETGIRHPDMIARPQCFKEPELMEPLAISIIGAVISTAYTLGVGLVIIFPVVYFVVKRKNIPSKPYLPLIISGMLLYYGTINLFIFNPRLPDFLYPDQDTKLELIGHLVFSFWIPIINYVIAGILLYKSSVIRKLIKK